MTKILKKTVLLLVAFILLLLLGVGVLVTFVSPNKFKPIIVAQVYKYSGRQLTIDGDLTWTFYPYLGFKVGHVVLNNTAQFKQKIFAEIDHAKIAVKLLPLLHAQVEMNELALSGLKLFLIKNAKGETNWQGWQAVGVVAIDDKTAAATPVKTNQKVDFNLRIPAIDIDNSQIQWIDEQAQQTTTFNQFEFHAADVSLTEPFTIKVAFDVLTPPATLTNHVTLAGKFHPNLAKQTLQLTQFTGQLANLTVSGNMDITDINTTPRATGHLQIQPLDLKKLLQATGHDVAVLQMAKMLTADIDFSTTPAPKNTALQSVQLQGKLKLDQLQAAKIRATGLSMQVQLQNGVLTLSPITASLYQGSLKAQTKINLLTSVPQISLQTDLTGVQAEPFLQDLHSQGNKLKIKGAGNINLKITTAGTDNDAIVRNLNGTLQFSFKNGQMAGMNIGYMINSAFALIKQKSLPTQNDNVTDFGDLTGTATIKNGVLTNNDLSLTSPLFVTKGQGTINLVSQQIDYSLKTTPSQTNNPFGLINLIIPITITGSLDNPNIRLDTAVLLQEVAKQQIQNRIQNITGPAGAVLQNLLGR